MMTVRNRVNMRTVYFILSLLLISCSKDDASEVPGKFELQSISIGEKQDQSSFENVAPNASIVLTFTDAVDEATIQSNIILKLNDQAVAYDSKLQGKDKLSLTPTGGFKSFSSYKLVINPGVKSTSGVSLTNGKVYEIRTGMDDSDKFDRIPDEDLLTLVQKQTFKYFWNFGHAHSGMACERTTSGDVVTTGGTGFGVMAMLGRHGDDKPADAPGGECLQYAVVGLVKPPELQKGIDSGGKQAERRQIPRRSRFCGGQVLQYIYIHRSVVFKLRPVARRCRREAEGFDTHGSAGFQNRRIRQSQNSVQLFERQRKNGTARCSGYRKPRTMCSEKDRRRRRSGWDVRSCGVESEEVLLKLGKGEIVGAFPRLVGCMEFPPDGNQVVDSIGVAFGQTLLRTIDYDRGDETTLFRTVVE